MRRCEGDIGFWGIDHHEDERETRDLEFRLGGADGRVLVGGGTARRSSAPGRATNPASRRAASCGSRSRRWAAELVVRGDKLAGFTIAGADGKFVPAEAVIDGNTVVLTHRVWPPTVAARYGYAKFVNPLCNLYNKEGLPASPFRTNNGVVALKE